MESVFVYGTLLTGESNHDVVEPFLQSVEPGVVHGWLYNVGPFPGLVLDGDGNEIKGEWLTVTKEGLKDMDRLEGYRGKGFNNFYNRVRVKDANTEREGWVYVWEDSRGHPEISSGDWRNRHV